MKWVVLIMRSTNVVTNLEFLENKNFIPSISKIKLNFYLPTI